MRAASPPNLTFPAAASCFLRLAAAALAEIRSYYAKDFELLQYPATFEQLSQTSNSSDDGGGGGGGARAAASSDGGGVPAG